MLGSGLLKPNTSACHLSDRGRDLLNWTIRKNDSLGSASDRAVKKCTLLVARHDDHACLLKLRNKLLESSELIVQNFRVHQQHIRRVTANGFHKVPWILAFGKNPNVTLIGNRTPHSNKRKRLIVRNHNIDIGHMTHSPTTVLRPPR